LVTLAAVHMIWPALGALGLLCLASRHRLWRGPVEPAHEAVVARRPPEIWF
jgi:hypothetical protein